MLEKYWNGLLEQNCIRVKQQYLKNEKHMSVIMCFLETTYY